MKILTQILKLKFSVFLILIVFISENCELNQSKVQTLKREINRLSSKHIIDKSLEVFETRLEKVNGRWTLDGETSNKILYESINATCDSLFNPERFKNNVQLLPDYLLGDSLYAIINVSVTPIKDKPSHSSQIIDQGQMGNQLKLLRFEGGWYLSQTHYNYVGWVNQTAIQICDSNQIKDWSSSKLVRISMISDHIYSKPNLESQPISDIVLNNKLKLINKNAGWSLIQLPDKRFGYIKNTSFIEENEEIEDPIQTRLKLARQMMGTPYLWGGNSSKGNDCSGFTQNIFEASGIQLPRDARQQALYGKEIVPNNIWSNIQPGDLLFFGKEDRVTHVGMSLGQYDFIHQGGMVGINSLTKASIVFAPKRLDTFLFIKRIH
jgi:gamma-D-glutamyl-L-lysine dipeptidyl-peptidase